MTTDVTSRLIRREVNTWVALRGQHKRAGQRDSWSSLSLEAHCGTSS